MTKKTKRNQEQAKQQECTHEFDEAAAYGAVALLGLRDEVLVEHLVESHNCLDVVEQRLNLIVRQEFLLLDGKLIDLEREGGEHKDTMTTTIKAQTNNAHHA